MEPYNNITSRPMVYHNPWLHKLAAKASGYDNPKTESKTIDNIVNVDIDSIKSIKETPYIPEQESSRDSLQKPGYDIRGNYSSPRNYLGNLLDKTI